ncbi:hypothetical protein C8Q75DRAFT_459787 [Abortiporus biennis]|nr:hypothetical protein C8Q75DRAFT_459787 [Abortiporus biennis]
MQRLAFPFMVARSFFVSFSHPRSTTYFHSSTQHRENYQSGHYTWARFCVKTSTLLLIQHINVYQLTSEHSALINPLLFLRSSRCHFDYHPVIDNSIISQACFGLCGSRFSSSHRKHRSTTIPIISGRRPPPTETSSRLRKRVSRRLNRAFRRVFTLYIAAHYLQPHTACL